MSIPKVGYHNHHEVISMSQLTADQIKDFARTVAIIDKTIAGFFDDPDNEKAYQDWYFRKYGHHEKESTYA